MKKKYKYWAFISYSHTDSNFADWFHKKLETYKVPKELVGKSIERGYDVPKRLFPVFRDREELPGSSDLASNIQEALSNSRYLIVVCSSRSAVSQWVNQEVMAFKRLGRAHKILCVIIDGEPNASDEPSLGKLECFPEAVRYKISTEGKLTDEREEPIAADAREGKDGKRYALIKIIAGLIGVGFDDLKKRDDERKRRMRLLWTVASIFILCLFFP